MAQTIRKPVGKNCGPGGNQPADTKTIQTLLNKVPAAAGGPSPLLAVDGICGPKTIAAINQFQIKQFGWKVADSTVEPGRQTLARLNAFDSPLPGPSPVPPVPVPPDPPADPVGNYFMIRGLTNQVVSESGNYRYFSSEDAYYFEIQDVVNRLQAVYRLTDKRRSFRGQFIRKPRVVFSPPSFFKTINGHTLRGIIGIAEWNTMFDENFAPVRSWMIVPMLGERVQIEILHHMGGDYPFRTLGSLGDFELVEGPSAF
jgi:hypothetical protein